MTLCVTFALIFAGLRGIQSLNTVSHIMMEVGGTVQIPCQYEQKYKDNVKYLCRGNTWSSCTYEIRSDEANSAKYSINDDKVQRIVTFTIKNLVLRDSNYYWCNIERSGTDDGKQFQLSVTRKDELKLSVDSQLITGYFDGQITINCKHKGYGLKEWCRIGGPCLSVPGKINGAQVSIERPLDVVFAVTMTGLNAQNTGWYWCGFGDLQMPVFVQITKRPTTTTLPTTTTMSTMSTVSTVSTAVFSTNTRGVRSDPKYIPATAIALGLLIIIVILLLVAWFMLKRQVKKTTKTNEVESSASPESPDCPVYSDVVLRPASHQNKSTPKEMDVCYSTVNFRDNQASQTAAVTEEDVLYSTLALH